MKVFTRLIAGVAIIFTFQGVSAQKAQQPMVADAFSEAYTLYFTKGSYLSGAYTSRNVRYYEPTTNIIDEAMQPLPRKDDPDISSEALPFYNFLHQALSSPTNNSGYISESKYGNANYNPYEQVIPKFQLAMGLYDPVIVKGNSKNQGVVVQVPLEEDQVLGFGVTRYVIKAARFEIIGMVSELSFGATDKDTTVFYAKSTDPTDKKIYMLAAIEGSLTRYGFSIPLQVVELGESGRFSRQLSIKQYGGFTARVSERLDDLTKQRDKFVQNFETETSDHDEYMTTFFSNNEQKYIRFLKKQRREYGFSRQWANENLELYRAKEKIDRAKYQSLRRGFMDREGERMNKKVAEFNALLAKATPKANSIRGHVVTNRVSLDQDNNEITLTEVFSDIDPLRSGALPTTELLLATIPLETSKAKLKEALKKAGVPGPRGFSAHKQARKSIAKFVKENQGSDNEKVQEMLRKITIDLDRSNPWVSTPSCGAAIKGA